MLKNMAHAIMDYPENEDSSFFLCKELIKGYLDHTRGEYFTPQG